MRSHCSLSRRQPFKIGGNHRSLQHQSHGIATFPPRSGGDILDANGIKYYDPQTWPKDWTAFELEGLLRGNLLNPAANPNYESLVMLLKNGDHKSLALLLRAHVKPPPPTEVHLEQYLGDSAAMPLQERTEQINALDAALSPQPGSVVPRVVFCSSPRGSGKTQFVKWFVSQKRAEAMKYGRVIVRCCDKTAHQALSKSHKLSWVASLLENRSAGTSAASPNDVLCEIRTHVEAATGADQEPSKYCDPQTAYATWMSETARCFNIPSDARNVDPLIILDTCELLAEHDHKSLVHKSSGKPYTLLEAFCLAVPAPHAIVAIGCNAELDATDPVYLSKANVTNIGPLRPLSEEGYEKALAESWKYEADGNVRAPLHHLAGGVPRLLRLAHMKHSPTMSLASGSINAFSRCFDIYSAAARAQYPVQSQWFPQAYTCFLVSSTKAKVDGSDIIPVNPAWRHGSRDPHRTLTFNEAAMCSMGLFDPSTSRFLVPPITFSDVVAAREDVPILPSQLHPLLDADVVARYDKCTSKERDRKPPQLMEIDVESCLKPHLVEIVLPQPIEAVMRSQKRNITFGPMPHLATVSRRRKKDYMFDLSMLDRAMSPKLGSDQRNIARYHCKGNGMLLIREFLSSKRLTAAKKGRVIVSSCKSPWVTRLLSGAVDSADVAMCELIRTHVESITGLPQDPSKYCDPSSAFATWMSETAWFFRIAEGIGNVDPLIILQSCERLNKVDQNHLMHKTSRRPSTLLEAFCLALPSPHSMLLIGHNMQLETTDPTFANLVNMTSFP